MDKLTHYANLIKCHLSEIVALCNRRPLPGVDTLCVFDDERRVYVLLRIGWFKESRVRATIALFVRFRDGKIYVEQDGTEGGIATYLINAGVPQEDIVLAFHGPDMPSLAECAVS